MIRQLYKYQWYINCWSQVGNVLWCILYILRNIKEGSKDRLDIKTPYYQYRFQIIKIWRSWHRLIVVMKILIAGKTLFILRQGPDWKFIRLTIISYLPCFISKSDRHDDVIKWKHFPRYWPFVRGIHRSRWIPQHKGQWRGGLMFSLICARIKDWVNSREAGDLRRHRGHYDVNVMWIQNNESIERPRQVVKNWNLLYLPDDLRVQRMSSVWYNGFTITYPDEIAHRRKSSGWLIQFSWCHPDDLM